MCLLSFEGGIMKVGDLVSIETQQRSHMGIIIDLYDEGEPDGEAQILWDDGNIFWERLSQLQRRARGYQ